MTDNAKIVLKLREQMEEALREFNAARVEVESIVEAIVTDIRDNMILYVMNNIRRVIRKNPDKLAEISEKELEEMAAEVEAAVAGEMGRLIQNLRNFRGWNDTDTVYVESGSFAWKTIREIEGPVNKVLKKYNIENIELKNWTWLSLETNELVSNRFVESKKKYLDKRKNYKYLEMRHREEARIDNVLGRLPD